MPQNIPLTADNVADVKVGDAVFVRFQGDYYGGPSRRKARVVEVKWVEPRHEPELTLQYKPEEGETMEDAQYAYYPLSFWQGKKGTPAHSWAEINGEASVLLRWSTKV